MNRETAARLEEAAWLLRDQGADPFRVNAYLRAAATVRRWPESLDSVFRGRGLEGLEELPGVGPSIARAIHELIVRGRLPMLDRLRGAVAAASRNSHGGGKIRAPDRGAESAGARSPAIRSGSGWHAPCLIGA